LSDGLKRAIVAIYQLRTELVVLVTAVIGMDQLDEIAAFLKKMDESPLA